MSEKYPEQLIFQKIYSTTYIHFIYNIIVRNLSYAKIISLELENVCKLIISRPLKPLKII